MRAPKPPPTCEWILLGTWKPCGKPAIGTINKGAFCEKHAPKAQLMFGKLKMIVREELFSENDLRR